MKTWLTASALVVMMIGALAWQQSGPVVKAAQTNPPVQVIGAGQKAFANPGEKGATYFGIEAQTTRVTTRFRDGHVTLAERDLIGGVETTVRDRGGNERARLKVNRIDGSRDLIHYERTGEAPLEMSSDPGRVKPTLDWASRQAYALDKDGVSHLVWDNGTMRPKSVARRDAESDVDAVETVWSNGLVATLTRQVYSRREIAPGRVVQGPALVSELTMNGLPAGKGVWFEKDQVFAYTLPGLMAGMVVIGAEDLKAHYGGWPFTPDTSWLNLQMIASHHFKQVAAKRGILAKACDRPAPNRLAQFFMPTLSANDVGCDDFHWLDGGVVRGCCDDHDRCYAKSGCDSNTWWQVWRSWSCDRCNMSVVFCFFGRGQLDSRCLQRQECAG